MEFQTAIYTTLLHSLWMGLILAFITSIIVIATKKSTASLRYTLLTGALSLFVVSIGLVFYLELNNTTALTSSPDVTRLGNITAKTNTSSSQGQATVSSTQQLISNVKSMVTFWGSYSNQIVLIWFLIICAKSVQLLAGLHAVNYLKTNKVFKAGAYWENKVEELSSRLGIARKVEILQSGMAKVPMIAGHFKPIILVPLGMLNGLSLKEVEAIFSHELAHLKRNDYLVNLLQSLVEIIFFFNPGVLWISKLIKEERENCCDDLALSCTDNKHQYIKALISCQEFEANQPAYAMAITGRKNSLKERVSRMVFNSNSSLNRVEKTLLTVVLVSALILTAAFSKITEPAKQSLHPTPSLRGMSQALEITSLKSETLVTVQQDSTKKKAERAAAARRAAQQKADQAAAAADKRAAEAQRNIDVQVANDDNANYNADVKKYKEDAKKHQADMKKHASDMVKYKNDMAKYDTDMKKYAADVDKHANDPKKYPLPAVPAVPGIPGVPAVPASPGVAAVPAVPAVPPVPGVPATINRITAPRAPSAASVPTAPAAPKLDMTNDLKRDGLLNDTKNFKYQLNAEKLVINGVTQPAQIHQKYLNKYLKNKKGTITTSVSTD